MDKIIINIAEDYSITPGVRDEEEGDFSGERFLEELLLPKFDDAISKKVKLLVNLDGTEGYATSFLEAAFGGLTRIKKEPDLILNNIEIFSEEDVYLKEDIEEYIKSACDED